MIDYEITEALMVKVQQEDYLAQKEVQRGVAVKEFNETAKKTLDNLR